MRSMGVLVIVVQTVPTQPIAAVNTEVTEVRISAMYITPFYRVNKRLNKEIANPRIQTEQTTDKSIFCPINVPI